MYIKQITIQGFKSYKEQVIIEPFSSKCNVVVGRNGAGKSNFFSAIRFVLNDAYIKMTQEERQALIHEGANTTNLNTTTYVEILFDNSDHRFPTGKDTVTLRRAVGLKKDEYYLDGKPIPKQDVMNLLQSAGFSKANPYYIVPQGRISSITNCKDEDRLDLLKEVAGTRIYEEHREESLKIMQSTRQKKLKIEELLTSIQGKISNLDHEKADLAIYSELEKQKRACEYHMFQQDLIVTQDTMEHLEETYRSDLTKLSHSRKRVLEKEHDLLLKQTELSTVIHTLENVDQELDNLGSNIMKDEHQKNEVSACLLPSSTLDRLKRDLLDLQQEQQSLHEQISSKQSELSHMKSIKQSSIQEEEAKILSDMLQKKTQKEALIKKRGRFHHFSSASERDEWLRAEIKNLHESLSFEEQLKEDLNLELCALQVEKESTLDQLSSTTEDLKQSEMHLSSLQSDMALLTRDRDLLAEQRKLMWREEFKLDHRRPLIHEQLLKLERQMYSNCDRETSAGLDAVRRICQTFPDLASHVYGPVYELFTVVDVVYSTAIDITIGKRLFHVVVENEQIASRLVQMMNKEKSGRVTFLPLNRIQSKLPSYKDISQDQGIPLIHLIKYDVPKFEPIFNQIFSKTILVPDLEQGCKIARETGFRTITLEGDRVDKKGALTGGYIDSSSTRLSISKQLKQIQTEYSSLEAQLNDIKHQSLLLGQELDVIYGKIQHGDQEITKATNYISALLLKKRDLDKELNTNTILSREKLLSECEHRIDQLKVSIKSNNDELGTKLTNKLTKEETKTLEHLDKEVDQLEHQLVEVSNEKTLILKEILSCEHEIQDNLMKRSELIAGKIKEIQGQLSTKNDFNEQLIVQIRSRLQQYHEKTNSLQQEHESLVTKKQELSNQISDIKTSISNLLEMNNSSSISTYLSKKSTLSQKNHDLTTKIHQLGLIPEEFLTKYRGFSNEALVAEVLKLREQLQKYSHINQKALDQYNLFIKQHSLLVKRKQELDSASESIISFIQTLDMQKDEAVQRTFDQVSRYFTEIFSKIVPNGRAQLDLIRNLNPSANSSASSNSDNNTTDVASISSYSGIGVRVCFNGNEYVKMHQLSGGQKGIVSLALIFAIQKCDPAPFYLFDEIDANLDAAYRGSVASVIGEMSEQAQFIMTTFRPELLDYADKYYGVIFSHGNSHIQCIQREQAEGFLR